VIIPTFNSLDIYIMNEYGIRGGIKEIKVNKKLFDRLCLEMAATGRWPTLSSEDKETFDMLLFNTDVGSHIRVTKDER